MKFKRIEDYLNYNVDVNNFDNIHAIKTKLSSVTELNCDEMILIHKNRVLKNHKLIIDYNIDENDFILFSNEGMISHYWEESNQYKKNYFGEHCDRCDERKFKLKNGKPTHLLRGKDIFVYINSLNMRHSLVTHSNERIYDALSRLFRDFNKCGNCRGYELVCNGIYLDGNKTFADYGIVGEHYIICRSIIAGGGGRDPPTPMMIQCITGHYDSFEISSTTDKSEIINKISDKIKIPQKNIKLFQDKNQSKSNIDLQQMKTNQTHIDIYFIIKPNFENLVKLEKLGQGSYGTVFKCISIETKKEIAVKKLKIPSTNETKEYKLSFERELQVYSKHAHHPRIVKYERNFQTENAIFLVMEYMKGGSLSSYLKKNGRLSENKIKIFAKQMLEALQYLHKNQILHRDIKSDNILLDEDDNAKLCDFGLSKNLIDLASKDFLNGVIQSFVGTLNYMAPEIMNDEPYGSSADVWSFGATMVEMVTGFPPYYKLNACKVMKIISESRKIEYKYPENLSDILKSFIDSCLRSEPSSRSTTDQLLNHSFLLIC